MVSPLLVPLVEPVIVDRYDCIGAIPSLQCSLLFLSGRSDRYVGG